MSIFSRAGDVFKSNLNDLIDRAENPEKMVRQIILDMQKELNNAVRSLGEAVAGERIAEKQYQDAVRKSADWEAKAKTALLSDQVALARKALARKVSADEEAERCREACETISQQTEIIRAQVETLRAELEEAKSRQAILTARSQAAETRKHLAQSVSHVGLSGATEKLDRMEQKIMQKEAEAEAFAEIANVYHSENSGESGILSDTRIDSELQRLMKEINQS
ncbi:MAG: PspA/IM30 family protein [Oscillospiraceae bacterium]|nr:PspA/IM30 family protein [Oscillospiraceae bacterium]